MAKYVQGRDTRTERRSNTTAEFRWLPWQAISTIIQRNIPTVNFRSFPELYRPIYVIRRLAKIQAGRCRI